MHWLQKYSGWKVDKKVTTTRIRLDPENKIPHQVKLLKQNIRISDFLRTIVLKAWFEDKQPMLLPMPLLSRTLALEIKREDGSKAMSFDQGGKK